MQVCGLDERQMLLLRKRRSSRKLRSLLKTWIRSPFTGKHESTMEFIKELDDVKSNKNRRGVAVPEQTEPYLSLSELLQSGNLPSLVLNSVGPCCVFRCGRGRRRHTRLHTDPTNKQTLIGCGKKAASLGGLCLDAGCNSREEQGLFLGNVTLSRWGLVGDGVLSIV
jgi:hypothetical protein